MSESKLEKVITALEVCVGEGDFSACVKAECPYVGGSKDGYCITNLERDALALLKKQEEEIAFLKAMQLQTVHNMSNEDIGNAVRNVLRL